MITSSGTPIACKSEILTMANSVHFAILYIRPLTDDTKDIDVDVSVHGRCSIPGGENQTGLRVAKMILQYQYIYLLTATPSAPRQLASLLGVTSKCCQVSAVALRG